VEEREMGAGCGAPTLEKAVAAGEGELCGRATWQSPASVRKGNTVVFTRNRETIKVERSRLVWPDGYAGPRMDRPDGYAYPNNHTREFLKST
jgi:hypothetical protein